MCQYIRLVLLIHVHSKLCHSLARTAKFTQVSLQVDQEVPKGTDIEYYIAPYNGDGDHVWQPISPIGQNRTKCN